MTPSEWLIPSNKPSFEGRAHEHREHVIRLLAVLWHNRQERVVGAIQEFDA